MRRRKDIFQYYVEGEDDKCIVNTLKSEMFCIQSGKVNVLEFIEKVKPMQEQGVKISIWTMDPDAYKFDNASYVIEIIGMINNSGIEVILIDDSCLYFTVIDQNIVWYGNINFLGKESIEDNVMRVLDHNIANDLLELGLLKN